MMKCMKKFLGLVLGVLFVIGIGCAYSVASGADSTVTMTSFAGDYAARKAAGEGAVVTISNLEEFRLFQRELEESDDGLEGFSFRQEADIAPGDYHYTYDQDLNKFRVYRGENAVAAVNRNGEVYRADGTTASSIESLGLSDLILQKWEDARWFRGKYDGQGYCFRGFMMGIIDNKGSSFGGLFCDLGGGTIANVNVSDCCLVHCMTPIVNALMAGEIVNCHVSNIVGAADCCGGIAGLLWNGSVRDCTAEKCTYMFRSGYGEGGSYGGLGGIVGVIEQNSGGIISNCTAKDMTLYGKEYSQVGTGGIVGVASTSRADNIQIKNCYADVTMSGSAVSGGIVGKIQKDAVSSLSASFTIGNCSCSGRMVEEADSDGSDFGGIVGFLGEGVSNFKIENCVSCTIMEKTSAERRSMGTAGGIIGVAKENFTVDGSVFGGNIWDKGVKGQINSAGGIAGEILAGGKVVNSANFGNIVLGREADSVCGGLAGYISPSSSVSVANSLNVGGISGKTVGGLVGEMSQGSGSCRLHNNLSLGTVSGETMGMLVGDRNQGEISYCFQRRDMSMAFGSGDTGAENCSMVSESQMAGTETSVPIFGEGDDQGICQLVEILNRQCSMSDYRKSYAPWENTRAGYPFFAGMEAALSLTLPSLPADDGNVDITVTPMPAPGGNPSNTATPAPGGNPSNTATPVPGGNPSNTATPAPGGNPSNTATPEPGGNPSNTTTPVPGGNPSNAPAPTPGGNGLNTPAPSAGGSGSSGSGQSGSGGDRQLRVAGFSAKAVNYKRVKVTWKGVSGDGVMIYRSEKKKSGYQLLKRCGKSAKKYTDQTCRPGKKYYYQIRAYAAEGGNIRLGSGKAKAVKMPWLKTPVYRLTRIKGKDGQKYLQITMKKYQGKYVDIYLKKQGGKYLKASMRSHKISVYRGKIRFIYSKSGVKYTCKLRTYRIKKGKKQYSGYSSAKKIRL